MNLGTCIFRAAAGIALYALLSLLGVGTGKARAATSDNHPNEGAAYAHCMASVDIVLAWNSSTHTNPHCTRKLTTNPYRWECNKNYGGNVGYTCNYNGPTGQPAATGVHNFPIGTECVAPEVAQLDGTCKDPAARCLALNTGIANQGPVNRTWNQYCPASGCALQMDAGFETITSGTETFYRGQLTYTGASCTTDPSPPPDEEVTDKDRQQCTQDGSLVLCIKPDGQRCYKTTSGRMLCWRPGETGERTDGPVIQVRKPGTTPPTTPQTPPPDGETFSPPGPTRTETTTGPTTNITTNVTNFTTTNGTDAGGENPGDGETNDGTSGPAQGQDGGEDGGEGSVNGGMDCENQPQVVGDPILASVVLQTWGTKCAQLDANAVTSTGEIGDCQSAWTITGPPGDANVEKLKAARAEICGNDANGDGQPDWTEGDKPADPGEGEEDAAPEAPTGLNIGTDLLDTSGIFGGAGSCPALGVIDFGPLGTFDLSSEPMWCDLVTVMRAIVLLMAAFTAIKILMGGL